MRTVTIRFTPTREGADDDRDLAIETLLSVLRMGGQILSSEFPAVMDGDTYQVFVSIPEKSSVSRKHGNEYVKRAFDRIKEVGLKLQVVDLGHDPDSADVCRCRNRAWLVLFTNYVSTEPPVRCGNCFGVVPLYRLSPTTTNLLDEVICWQSDYRACDRLQMNCQTGERFGTDQLSRHSSSLSVRGRTICSKLADGIGLPVYYYLYRGNGRSLEREKQRRCPSCNSPWLVEKVLCGLFDMKCDTCKLVSNIAWNVWR